ncbi:MAG: hypothetical protein ACQEP1_01235 [Nanobdellota archaeon]
MKKEQDNTLEPDYVVLPIKEYRLLRRVTEENESCINWVTHRGRKFPGKQEKAENDFFYNPDVKYLFFQDKSSEKQGYARIFRDIENNGWVDGIFGEGPFGIQDIVEPLKGHFDKMFDGSPYVINSPEFIDLQEYRKELRMKEEPRYSFRFKADKEYILKDLFSGYKG